ncbi:MAG: serine/threonine protein kinase [Candidatus Sericytochromatia bacterium]
MLTPADLQTLQPLHHRRVLRGRSPDGQEVVLKRLSLAEAPDWKALELFHREAQLLAQLRHPRLPHLLAHGESESEAWLIYAWLPGTTLRDKLAAGWRPDTETVWELARQALELLDWLHGHHPPVVHRDLKPGNLILQDDGSLCLIDFGAVLQQLHPTGGSTVAGTVGYMAPEQFSGRALPVSDLYGLGATLVHLLTGRPPSELPSERLWLRFEDYVNLPPAQQSWLRRLLHPVAEERCPSARTALAELEAAQRDTGAVRVQNPVARWQEHAPPVPPGVEKYRALTLHKRGAQTEIGLPPRQLQGKALRNYLLSNGLNVSLCLVMTVNIYVQLGGLLPVLQMPALLSLLMLSCGGALWENHQLQRLLHHDTLLSLGPEGLSLSSGPEGRLHLRHHLDWQDIVAIEHRPNLWRLHAGGVVIRYRHSGVQTAAEKAPRVRQQVIGQLLSPLEQRWLSDLLQDRHRLARSENDSATDMPPSSAERPNTKSP